ncbi:MAG: hypothetical protein O6928_06905 [Gammaproteobacteria bacterium]|nr:hypothetical protein [Gammaproteobacteria bacterium]
MGLTEHARVGSALLDSGTDKTIRSLVQKTLLTDCRARTTRQIAITLDTVTGRADLIKPDFTQTRVALGIRLGVYGSGLVGKFFMSFSLGFTGRKQTLHKALDLIKRYFRYLLLDLDQMLKI